ncbi:MAG: InlB B-repeat-containing protein [Clostridia bacterium]|nr:InlB B-repeat-containing protein [Clostridia bacterium]
MQKKILLALVLMLATLMVFVACTEAAARYGIDVDTLGNGGTVSAKVYGKAGEQIDLTVNVLEGYRIKSITVNGEEIEGTSFIMPEGEVTIVVEFEKIPEVYTVRFVNWDDSELSVQSVTEGEAAEAPADPTREADYNNTYEFSGWDVDFTNVTRDIVVKAQYTATAIVRHTVTFVYNNGDENSEVEVLNGETLEEPDKPTNQGYLFTAWYTDAELTAEYDFDTAVTGDLTLYAGWEIYRITPTTSFDSGTGTETNPYIIKTAGQLAYLSDYVNRGLNTSYEYFELANDIDLNYAEWTPIGDGWAYGTGEFYRFIGSFNGKGHVIKNMRITESKGTAIGLFGGVENYETRPIVENVGMENVYINISAEVCAVIGGNDWLECGGLIGYAGNSITKHCYVKGTIIYDRTNVNRALQVGGMIGEKEGGIGADISYCYTDVDIIVTHNSDTHNPWCGGLAGMLTFGGSDNSYAWGSITVYCNGGTSVGVGGFAGYSGGYMTNCYSAVDVKIVVNNDAVASPWGGYGGFSSAHEDYDFTACMVLGGSFKCNRDSISYSYFNRIVEGRAGAKDNCVVEGFTVEGGTLQSMGVEFSFCTAAAMSEASFYTNKGWSADVWNLDNLDIANGVYPTLK